MRWPGVLLIGLAIILPLHAEDWTTADGKTYKNVTVLNQEDDGVRVTYLGGVGKIPYYELPVDIQKRFGQDIDSMAAKRRAVDQALEEAVSDAIAAEQIKQPKEATSPVANQPAGTLPAQGNPSGVQANGATANTTQTNGVENQQPNGAGNATPGGAGQANGANGQSPGTATTQSNGAPANGAVTANNGAPANGAPGNSAGPGGTAPGSAQTAAGGVPGAPANGGKPGGVAHAGGPGGGPRGEGMPALNDYVPGQGGSSNSAPELSPYPGAKVTYNEALDLCYLDSPPIDLISDAPRSNSKANQNASLTLRVVTEGRKPQAPEKIEATYLFVGGAGQVTVNSPIAFIVDGKAVSIDDSAKKDSGTMGGGGQSLFYLTFYLTPEQLKSISGGNSIQVSISPASYTLNGSGVAFLQAYQKDLEGLPPATSSFLRSYYKLLARVPSFVSVVTTVCEYLILGSFALLVCASIAAFIMGVTRFIKM